MNNVTTAAWQRRSFDMSFDGENNLMARSKQAPTAQHDETSSESDTSPQHATKGISSMALLVAGAFFMEYLDGTVIATALPQMARDFGVAAVDLNIGMSAYLITLAVLIPVSGWTAD